jgi:hypothetical protein
MRHHKLLLIIVFLTGLKPNSYVMVYQGHIPTVIYWPSADGTCSSTPAPNPLVTDFNGHVSFCVVGKSPLSIIALQPTELPKSKP